uniref:Uncharacterized protein n=1 Tax=Fagus sylvatica TaxID=28930 RepID=A0A2N9GX90_FAGSY
MVYGKFFRKPFSKTRVRLPLDSFHSHSVSALSLSHCLLSFFAVPSHRATPSRPLLAQNPPPRADLALAPDLEISPSLIWRSQAVTHLEPVSLSHPIWRSQAVTHRRSQAVTHLEPVSLSHPIWFSAYPRRRA